MEMMLITLFLSLHFITGPQACTWCFSSTLDTGTIFNGPYVNITQAGWFLGSCWLNLQPEGAAKERTGKALKGSQEFLPPGCTVAPLSSLRGVDLQGTILGGSEAQTSHKRAPKQVPSPVPNLEEGLSLSLSSQATTTL